MALYTHSGLREISRQQRIYQFAGRAAETILRETARAAPTKTFAIFLSSSSLDSEEVFGLKTDIEKLGWRVYVDWIEDAQLDRSNDVPAVLLSAHYGAKRGDNSVPPSWALRTGRVRASASARNLGMVIPWNYRVPRSSVIYEVFHGVAPSHTHADERLGSWTSSDGKGLRDLALHVEARRYGDEVLAILTPE
jgi:hypothetical protein